jgi:hypothetical protein
VNEQLSQSALLSHVGQKVSSSAPSLSPDKRLITDCKELSKFRHDSAIDKGFAEQRRNAAMDGSRPMDTAEAQVGRPMSHDMVQKRLETLNRNLIFQVSPADNTKVGIYILDKTATEGRRFIMGMEHGWAPEFTIRKLRWVKRLVVANPVPQYEDIPEYAGEKRGWRKVLAVLIRGRYISKVGAEKAFGLPTLDSKQWQELTET